MLNFYLPWSDGCDQHFEEAPDFSSRPRRGRKADPERDRFRVSDPQSSQVDNSHEDSPVQPSSCEAEASEEQAYLDHLTAEADAFIASPSPSRARPPPPCLTEEQLLLIRTKREPPAPARRPGFLPCERRGPLLEGYSSEASSPPVSSRPGSLAGDLIFLFDRCAVMSQ